MEKVKRSLKPVLTRGAFLYRIKGMETIKTTNEGAVTLAVSGKLSAATAEDFEKAVSAALTEASKSFTLDFKEVTYLASAGLRVLVAAQKKLTPLGLNLSLVNVRDEVREVFEITGLDEVFNFA
jgi:anti-anti-sigma factor